MKNLTPDELYKIIGQNVAKYRRECLIIKYKYKYQGFKNSDIVKLFRS